MLDNVQGPTKVLLSVLMFPLFFQDAFLSFAWGAADPLGIQWAKRMLLLLPVSAIVFSCWVTIVCALTVIVRQRRRDFVTAIFITWWDLGRAILSFWGGIVKFAFYFSGWVIALVRLAILGLWLSIQDIVLTPIRIVRSVGEAQFEPGVPWLAVVMTILWSLLEAGIFTFFTTTLVMDVIEGMSEAEVSEAAVQIPLFFFMVVIVLGSYAVLSTWGEAVKKRDIPQIIQIGIVEGIVLIFEVLFLYREFVASLEPWFAQYAGDDFRLGLIGVIGIAGFSWCGVRGVTWFLFAKAGSPMIMSIIQNTGFRRRSEGKGDRSRKRFEFVHEAIDRIKSDLDWVHNKGDEMLGALILPPLQILAASINFCSLLMTTKHVFELPFRKASDIAEAKRLLSNTKVGNG